MKSAALLFAAFLGAWSWLRPAPPRTPCAWPAGIPAFAGARTVNFASRLGDGAELVNLVVPEPAGQVLAAARGAFAEAGWTESPVRTRDMLVFTRAGAVAAVLAQSVPAGTRVTAIQRPRGL